MVQVHGGPPGPGRQCSRSDIERMFLVHRLLKQPVRDLSFSGLRPAAQHFEKADHDLLGADHVKVLHHVVRPPGEARAKRRDRLLPEFLRLPVFGSKERQNVGCPLMWVVPEGGYGFALHSVVFGLPQNVRQHFDGSRSLELCQPQDRPLPRVGVRMTRGDPDQLAFSLLRTPPSQPGHRLVAQMRRARVRTLECAAHGSYLIAFEPQQRSKSFLLKRSVLAALRNLG